MITLFIGLKGSATSLEGVYIEEKGTVVFFSDAYQVVSLKSEDKIVFSISKKKVKKDIKPAVKSLAKNHFFSVKKNEKKLDIKIPIKHLLFNVKNIKKREMNLFQSKDTNIIFYMSNIFDPFLSTNRMTYIGVEIIYFIQNQLFRLFLYSYPCNFWYLNIQYAFLSLFLSVFFYLLISKKAKNATCILRRGPPSLLF
jgi:hypothetical protein